nr:MAG TPA: hypothetical protein [Caudoviricetes sp.]
MGGHIGCKVSTFLLINKANALKSPAFYRLLTFHPTLSRLFYHFILRVILQRIN